MSSTTECMDFGGKAAARLPEKPSFSHTCTLLSQYLKEKGSFGDLSLGMTCSSTEANGMSVATRQPTTMNLFPCELSAKKAKEDALRMTDSGSANLEPQTAQMTIFYAGQVMVFNDFSADRAKEIMNFASRGSAKKSYTAFTSDVKSTTTQGVFAPTNIAKIQTESRLSVPPSPNPVASLGKTPIQDQVQPSSAPIACELPIARRASLHRFLEKRKDRITAKAPYQTNGSAAAPSKSAESNSWLGLMAAQSPQ